MNRLTLAVFLALLSATATAQFHDQGFQSAVSRTDYNSQTEGQPSNPVTFVSPCLFPGQVCGTGPTTYDSTNSFAQNVQGFPQSNYWVLSINNEPSFDKVCPSNPDPGVICEPGVFETTNNPGPPNQSLPRSSPGFGVMGFTAIKDSLPGENFFRAHLVLNGTWPNPNNIPDVADPPFVGEAESQATPFLAIGADAFRGNGGNPGYIHWFGRPHRVTFKARLWDFDRPTLQCTVKCIKPTLVFYLVAITDWGTSPFTPRGIQLALFHDNHDQSTENDLNPGSKKFKWNWPMQESFYHPGAEWAFIDAEDVMPLCGFSVPRLTSIGQEIPYNVDLEALFQCVSDLGGFSVPMPGGIHPIRGVHWALEMTGVDGALWTSVHDMKMQ